MKTVRQGLNAGGLVRDIRGIHKGGQRVDKVRRCRILETQGGRAYNHQRRAPLWHGSPRRGAETRPLEVPVRGPLKAVLSTVSKEQGLRSQSAAAEQ